MRRRRTRRGRRKKKMIATLWSNKLTQSKSHFISTNHSMVHYQTCHIKVTSGILSIQAAPVGVRHFIHDSECCSKSEAVLTIVPDQKHYSCRWSGKRPLMLLWLRLLDYTRRTITSPTVRHQTSVCSEKVSDPALDRLMLAPPCLLHRRDLYNHG